MSQQIDFISSVRICCELEELINQRLKDEWPLSSLYELRIIQLAAIDFIRHNSKIDKSLALCESRREEVQRQLSDVQAEAQAIEQSLLKKRVEESTLKYQLSMQDEEVGKIREFSDKLAQIRSSCIGHISGGGGISSSTSFKNLVELSKQPVAIIPKEERPLSSPLSSASKVASAPSENGELKGSKTLGLVNVIYSLKESIREMGDNRSVKKLSEDDCWTLLREVGISGKKVDEIRSQVKSQSPPSLALKLQILSANPSLEITQQDLAIGKEEAARLLISFLLVENSGLTRIPRSWIQRQRSQDVKPVVIPQPLSLGGSGGPKPKAKSKSKSRDSDSGNDQEEHQGQVVLPVSETAKNVISMTKIDEIISTLSLNMIGSDAERNLLKRQMVEQRTTGLQLVMGSNELPCHFKMSSSIRIPLRKFLNKELSRLLKSLPRDISKLEEEDGVMVFYRSNSDEYGPFYLCMKPSDALNITKIDQLVSDISALYENESSVSRSLTTASLSSRVGNADSWTGLNSFFKLIYEDFGRPRPKVLASLASTLELKKMDYCGKRLTRIPPEIGYLTNLQELHLYSNRLKEVPPEIGYLTNLVDLRLSNNLLEFIPPEIGYLTNLLALSLYQNHITLLPPEIAYLSGLHVLNLGANRIKLLPADIGYLSELERLLLNNNELESIPTDVEYLCNLRLLNICENNRLPAEFKDRNYHIYSNLPKLSSFLS